MKKNIQAYWKDKQCIHEGWVKKLKLDRQNIDFNKSYVVVTRDPSNPDINPRNIYTYSRILYKLFFLCKCPNLKGDGSNHTLENCRHYQRQQHKRLEKGELLKSNIKNYQREYRKLKQLYKPIDYHIYFYIKKPHRVRNHQGGVLTK